MIDAQSIHGVICSVGGWTSRGTRYLDRAAAAISEDNLASRFLNLLYKMVAAYTSGQFDQCKELATHGLEVGHRRGDLWRANIFKIHDALADYRLGNLPSSLTQARREFDNSIRMGDRNTSRDHLNLVAILTDGDFPYEQMASNLIPVPDNYQATNQELQAEARWHLFHDRTQEGLQVAQQAYDLMMKHFVVNHITCTNFPLILQAMRQHATTLAKQNPAEADQLLRRGYRTGRWAVRIGEKLPDYPATLRELAHLVARRGKLKKAIRILNKSRQLTDARSMRYESALTTLAWAEYVTPRTKLEGKEKEVFQERDRKLEAAREARRSKRAASQRAIA